MACCVKRPSRPRYFRSAIRFDLRSTLGVARANMPRCEVDRMSSTAFSRSRRIMRACPLAMRILSYTQAVHTMCCGRPNNCSIWPIFRRHGRADNPDVALMQALLEAFPDRLAKLRRNAGSGAAGWRPRRSARQHVARARRAAIPGDRCQRCGRRSTGAARLGRRPIVAAGRDASYS